MTKLMPRSYYARFAARAYEELTFNGRQHQLDSNSEWRRIKLPEIVYTFHLVANKFFGHILNKSAFTQGYTYDWCDPKDEADLVKHFTSPTPQYVPQTMPMELRPHPPQLQTPYQLSFGNHNDSQGGPCIRPHENNNNTSNRPYGSGGNNGNNTGNQTGRGNQHSGGNHNNGSDGINRRLHPLLQEFWSSVPENRRNIGLRPYCQAAGTTVSRFVLQLGLQRDDCGLFHGTGNCVLAASGNCRNRHVPRDLNRNNVQQAVTTLRQGLQQIN